MSGVTDVRATLRWMPVSAESYNVKVFSSPDADPQIDEGDIYDGEHLAETEVSLSGLTPDRMYYAYIQGVCVDGTSAWTDVVQFRTMCAAEPVPFLEDFENDESIGCWRIGAGGDAYVVSSTSHSGVNSYALAAGKVTNLVSPMLALESPITEYMLTFYVYTYTYVDSVKLSIGVAPDPSNLSDIWPVQEFNFMKEDGWHEVVVYFNSLSQDGLEMYASAKNIVVTSNDLCYIDDVSVDKIPECPKPTNIRVEHVSYDGATLDWELMEETLCHVEIRQGDMLVKDYTDITHPLTVEGLEPKTKYTVEVTAICGEGEESEAASVTFSTECGLYSFPFKESFNSLTGGTLPECWSDSKKGGPEPEHSYNEWSVRTSDYVIEVETPCAAFDAYTNRKGNMCLLQTPLIDLTEIDAAELSFMTAAPSNGLLHVAVSMDGGNTFADTIAHGVLYTQWTEFVCDLSAYCGKVISVGFIGESNYGNSYVYVDDVSVDVPTKCRKPSSMIAGEAEADRVELTIEDEIGVAWEIAFGLAGFNPDTTVYNVQQTDDKNVVLSGLRPSSLYEAYVRCDCGADGYSKWVGPVAFSTLCAAMPVTYEEDFEMYATASDLRCFDILSSSGNMMSEYYIATEDDVVISGNRSLLLENDNFDAYIVFPEMDEDVEKLMFRASVRSNMEKFYSETGLLHKDSLFYINYAFVPVVRTEHGSGLSEAYGYFNRCGRSGRDYRIAMRIPGIGSMQQVAVDDVMVSLIPPFAAPYGVEVAEITENSATVTWQVSDEAAVSEVRLDEGEAIMSRTNTYVFTGLMPDTEYTVTVRSMRGDEPGDTTDWSIPVTFVTYQTPGVVPYNCNFESGEQETSLWRMRNGESKIEWTISGNDADAVYQGGQALYVTGEDGLHYYYGNVASEVYASRLMKLNAGRYNVSFMYHSEGSNPSYPDDYMCAFLVPAETDADMYSPDWIEVSEELYNKREWTLSENEVKVPTDGYYNLVFMWKNKYNWYGYTQYVPAAIDSVVVESVPCVSLYDVVVDSVSAVRASVSWADENVGSHIVEYVLLAGGEDFDEENVEVLTAMGDSLRLNSLKPETDYTIRLRAVCGEYYTEWTEPVEFTTPCAPVKIDIEHEFVDDFEECNGYDLGCWEHSDLNVGYAYWWYCNSDYEIDPYSGRRSVIARMGEQVMMTRLVELKRGLSYQLLFYACQDAGENNGTHVNVTLGGEHEKDIDLSTVWSADISSKEYELFTARFAVEKDGVYKLGLRGNVIGATKILSIDSVAVRAVECDCPYQLAVYDITASSAKVKWSGVAKEYEVTVDVNGIQNEQRVQGTELQLSDLYGSSKYSVSVRSVCGDGSLSEPAEIGFNTLCGGTAPAPYFEDFDGFGTLPPCWTVDGTKVSIPWNYRVELNGNGVLMFESSENGKGSTDFVISPSIEVPSSGYSLSVDYINPAGGPLSIYLSDDGGVSIRDTILYKTTGISAWRNVRFSLDDYAGGAVTMIAYGESSYSLLEGAYIYLDNFRVSRISDTKELRDTVCYGDAYISNGFEVLPGVLDYGDNTLTRMAYGVEKEAPDTIYELTVHVPFTDYYVEDVIVPGQAYSGYGFEGITEAGRDYTRTLRSEVTGCDSTVHLNLRAAVLSVEISDTVCEGGSVMFCGEERTESGDYTCTEANRYGVDSTTVLHLTVLPSEVVRKDTVCEGGWVDFGGERRTESGVYEADSVNALGCTYRTVLELTVLDSVSRVDTTVCHGRYVEYGGVRYSESGEYRISLPAEHGCDRVLLLGLTVIAADTAAYSGHACEGRPLYEAGFAGTMVYGDTVLYRTDRTACGCDSVTRLDVTYIPKVEAYDTVHVPDKVYEYDGRTLTVGGDYQSDGIDVYGCDSVHHLHLEFTTGTGAADAVTLTVVPNPVDLSETAYVDGDWGVELPEGMRIEVTDVSGRTVYAGDVEERPVPVYGIKSRGVYLVRIISPDGMVYTGRLIVK